MRTTRCPVRCFRSLFLFLLLGTLFSAILNGEEPDDSVRTLRPKIHRAYPHDREAFTQGLLIKDGAIFESTGQYGESTLRELDPQYGVVRVKPLPENHFGEGLALAGDRLIQLTWQSGVAHVYDISTFEKINQFHYDGEGWGLAYDGNRLIMSDGSPRLSFREPNSFDVLSSVTVTLRGRPVPRINELEWAEGHIWANVWKKDIILKIEPATGRVVAVVDASNLLEKQDLPGVDVLNGIAWDEEKQRFLITGKYWPKMFEVTFEPATQ